MKSLTLLKTSQPVTWFVEIADLFLEIELLILALNGELLQIQVRTEASVSLPRMLCKLLRVLHCNIIMTAR